MSQASVVSDELVESFSRVAHYTPYYGWYLKLDDVMGRLECGDSKARRVRAIIVTRLKSKYPKGLPEKGKDGEKIPES